MNDDRFAGLAPKNNPTPNKLVTSHVTFGGVNEAYLKPDKFAPISDLISVPPPNPPPPPRLLHVADPTVALALGVDH